MNPNPKITISVSDGKATATLTGMVTVGAAIDVVINGLPGTISEWGSDDKYVGSSLRLRIVDEIGRDVARFPLIEKTSTSDGDKWTVNQSTYVYTNYSDCSLDLDTDKMRCAFRGVPFNDKLEFGLILDSSVDEEQFAIGKIKIKQWAKIPSEDPTILPDWRTTIATITSNLTSITEYKQAAASSATIAAEAASDAELSKNVANAAKTYAEAAVAHYPRINSSTYHWEVYTNGTWVDTGVSAKGEKGEAGGHEIFEGQTFTLPTNDRERNNLIAYMIREMGGNISSEGITPGTSLQVINMKASDGTAHELRIVPNSEGEYTTEVS